MEKKGMEVALGFGTGVIAGTVMGALLAGKPAKAAPPEERIDYLISLIENIGILTEKIYNGQADAIKVLQDILKALGGAPGGEITALTPWRGKEPVQMFSQAITVVGTYFTDTMLSWVEGKRLLIKAESSLNQPIQLQPFGNIANTRNLSTDIGAPAPCGANGNASIGFAWDDWHPYIGVRITVPVAPTNGILTIWAVLQD